MQIRFDFVDSGAIHPFGCVSFMPKDFNAYMVSVTVVDFHASNNLT